MAQNYQHLSGSKARQWWHLPIPVQVDRHRDNCSVYPAGDWGVVLMDTQIVLLLCVFCLGLGLMVGLVRGMQIQYRANQRDRH